MHIKIKRIVRTAILIGAPLIAVPNGQAKPNILYINADDLGVMDVGYNNSKFRTPNIDRLAREGMTFTNGYAPAANCGPSRACVHSGQWGARHGVFTVGKSARGKAQYQKLIPTKNRPLLPPEVYTLAEALKDGGYRTIHLGKYHIGTDPLQDGFEVNVGGDETGNPRGGYFSPWKKDSMAPWSDRVPPQTHRLDVYVREAIRFMDAHKNESMFIHFAPYLVHDPLTPVPEYMSHYAGTGLNATYASMVEKMDDGIGKLLDALDEKGLTKNTLVVFCSDNGGLAKVHTQQPFRAGKGSYYEGGVREPMVMRWPGKIKAGRCCDEVVNALDFYPTFTEVAGLNRPAHLDGVSLLPLMNGAEEWNPMPQFWHFPIYLQPYNAEVDDGRDPLFRTRPGSAMRMGKWKLHEYFEDGAIELYDLEQDGGERQDVARLYPEKTEELHRMLTRWRARIHAPVPTKLNPKYDAQAERKALKKCRK